MKDTDKPEFKVIIAGGRYFSNYTLLKQTAMPYLESKRESYNVVIISGNAAGADSLGEKLADELGLGKIVLPAEWEKYGRQAGIVRNRQMASMADALIAFWDGKSRGTKHMIDTAIRTKLHVTVVKYAK